MSKMGHKNHSLWTPSFLYKFYFTKDRKCEWKIHELRFLEQHDVLSSFLDKH